MNNCSDHTNRLVVAILLSFLVLGLSGCVTSYTPHSREGAICKNKCATIAAGCGGSSYTCDGALSACYNSCAEIEQFPVK